MKKIHGLPSLIIFGIFVVVAFCSGVFIYLRLSGLKAAVPISRVMEFRDMASFETVVNILDVNLFKATEIPNSDNLTRLRLSLAKVKGALAGLVVQYGAMFSENRIISNTTAPDSFGRKERKIPEEIAILLEEVNAILSSLRELLDEEVEFNRLEALLIRNQLDYLLSEIRDYTDRNNTEILMRLQVQSDQIDILRQTIIGSFCVVSLGLMAMVYYLVLNRRIWGLLEEALERAEQASEEKSIFLATMSHEIRTPLNAIIGLLALLRKTDLEEIQENYLTKAILSSRILLRFVNGLLDFSKIEAGKIELEDVDFDLVNILDDVRELFSEEAKTKGLGFQVNHASDVPRYLVGDPHRLEQIIINLLGNAIKFTETGDVRLDVSRREGDPEEKQWLVFQVWDTGVGMSPEELEKVLEPYQQAKMATSRQYGGTGLGLTLCFKVAKLMGGDLKIESRPGEGSTFTVSLPMEIGRSSLIRESDQTLRKDKDYLKGLSILLVDDDPLNRVVGSALLNSEGLHVTVASGGREAVNLVRDSQQGFDAVLMDLEMPDMSGLEAARRIRKLNGDIPIIALTADARSETRKKVLDGGMDNFLTKPLYPKILFETLARTQEKTSLKISHATVEAEDEDLPVFDHETALYRIGNDKELLSTLMAELLKECAGLVDRIDEALAEERWEDAVRESHTVCGNAGNLGGMLIYKMARRFEELLRGGVKPSDEERAGYFVAVKDLEGAVENFFRQ